MISRCKFARTVLYVTMLAGLLQLFFAATVFAAAEIKLCRDVVDKVEKYYVDPPDYQLMLRGAMRGLDEDTLVPEVKNGKELSEAVAELIYRSAVRTGKPADAMEVKAARQMLASLDPHSNLMTPDEYKELFTDTSGKFSGIGAEIKATDAGIQVVSPLEGTPAFEAGIKPGDIIISIDGASTIGMELVKAVRMLRGREGTGVTLQVRQKSGIRTVTVVRRAITIQSVKYSQLGDGIGYVKITQFREKTAQSVENALYSLSSSGSLQGLVVDLRNDPGGLLNESVSVADLFVDTGRLLSVKGRMSGQQAYEGKTIGTHHVPAIVVLINKGTASAAEMLAGILQERKGALVLGEKSFGKGSVQTIYTLASGYAMRLTTAHYYLPSGRMVQAGIEPDIAIEQQDGNDVTLAYARLALKTGKTDKGKKDELFAMLASETGAGIVSQTVAKTAGPPVIQITAPALQRGLAVKTRFDTITVTGIARSQAGIARVTVNDQSAALDAQGNFSAELLLKPGENGIVVQAIDLKRVAATEQFRIVRETVKPVLQAAIPQKEHGIGSGTYHALLIAVQDYRSAEITRLDHPIHDASRLQEILVSDYTFNPANVTLLKNPDRKAIFKVFEALRKKVASQDSLLVFFAGHGVWLEDMQQGFWLPRDAAGMQDPSDWISNSTLRDYIKAIKARHVLLVADACFAGGIFKVRDAFSRPEASIEKVFEMPSRKALTSGSLKTVPDRSVFVEYLLKYLKQNRDQYVDAQKLYTRFRDAVINNSPVSQTPLYGAIAETGDEGGDFIFVRRRQP